MSKENTTESKRELPIYHWSEIASPRFKLTEKLFLESITVTQTVHKRNQTPKTTQAHPAFVVYDVGFVNYKLLEVIAPLIAEELIDKNIGFDQESFSKGFLEQSQLVFDKTYANLISSLATVLTEAIQAYGSCAIKSEDFGITLNPTASVIVRSFKLVQELARTTDPDVLPVEDNNKGDISDSGL
ncbi:MAG: hypothetical protein ACM65M_10615 [Microcoleus sp.]